MTNEKPTYTFEAIFKLHSGLDYEYVSQRGQTTSEAWLKAFFYFARRATDRDAIILAITLTARDGPPLPSQQETARIN